MALVVKNRALSLATRGLLGGSVIALATHGLIQIATEVDVPIEPAPPALAAGGASTYVDYRDDFPVAPKRYIYKFVSGFTLHIAPASRAWLTVCPPLHGYFRSRDWTLTLQAESESRFFDQQADEEDLILAWAAKWILDDDDDGGFYL